MRISRIRAAREERASGEHLGQHDADGEQIAAVVDFPAEDLLRGHVAQLALQLAGHRAPFGEETPGDAEVDELDVADAADQHVGRRHVAVDDVQRAARLVGGFVREREREEDLVGDVERRSRRDRLSALRGRAKQRGAGDAVHVLHHDVELALVLAELEHLGDVRMVQRPGDPRFVAEHLDELRIFGELRQDALDGDALGEAMRAAAAGQVHLGHAALTELALEDVLANRGSGCGAYETHRSENIRLQRCSHEFFV